MRCKFLTLVLKVLTAVLMKSYINFKNTILERKSIEHDIVEST